MTVSSAPAASTPDQPGRLRVEMLRVVDQQQPDPARSAASRSGSAANASSAAPTSSAAPSAGTVACGAAIPTADRSSMTCS